MNKAINQLRILVVDDSSINTRMFDCLLKSFGVLSVLIAYNGQQAIELYRQHQFDLILMDIEMPIMDGIAAINQIKKENQNQKVVLQTTKTLEDIANLGLLYDVDGYIRKPIDVDLLKKSILDVCYESE